MATFSNVMAQLPALFEGRPALVRQAARADVTLLVSTETTRRRLILRKGKLQVAPADGPMDSWDVALRGEARVWHDHWLPLPPPTAADIFGMRRHGRLVIEGNFLRLMLSLQLVKDILALPRGAR